MTNAIVVIGLLGQPLHVRRETEQPPIHMTGGLLFGGLAYQILPPWAG
jgi:hypothetical protein